jgi:hypothetical protein
MHLKKLHEKASWQKLNEQDFRTKTTGLILEHEELIEKLSIISESLTEQIFALQKQLGVMSNQHARLNKQMKSTQKVDDVNTHTEQKRNS